MILIDPTTGCEVETFTDAATEFLKSHGYKPKQDGGKKPAARRTTQKRAAKPKE